LPKALDWMLHEMRGFDFLVQCVTLAVTVNKIITTLFVFHPFLESKFSVLRNFSTVDEFPSQSITKLKSKNKMQSPLKVIIIML
jgi:hypothetical protein